MCVCGQSAQTQDQNHELYENSCQEFQSQIFARFELKDQADSPDLAHGDCMIILPVPLSSSSTIPPQNTWGPIRKNRAKSITPTHRQVAARNFLLVGIHPVVVPIGLPFLDPKRQQKRCASGV